MAFKVKHLHVKSRDPQKSAKWWVENLGAKMVSARAQGRFTLDLHGIELNVTSFVEGQTRLQRLGLEHIAISTDDLDNVVNKLKANGARVLDERKDSTGRSAFFFETPEGVQLELSGED